MKLLKDGKQIKSALTKAFEKYSEFYCAVAWAGDDQDIFALFKKYKDKIKKVIIGTHFSRTSPFFIEAFKGYKGIKYNKNSRSLFHPKLYLFKNGKEWLILIGSANLTHAAFEQNKEVVLLVDSKIDKHINMFEEAFNYVQECWVESMTFSDSELKDYKKAYLKSRQSFKELSKIPKKHKAKEFDAPIGDLTWKDFSKAVFNEKLNQGHGFKDRLKMITKIQRLFAQRKHLNKMKTEQRQAVAGLLAEKDDIDYGLFGSMRGQGEFWKQIKRNNKGISKALDYIPLKGDVTEEQYNKFVKTFIQAIPNAKNPRGTATRLLTMKRPDFFVCINKMNMKKLSKKFFVPKSIGIDRYWTEIIERIHDSKWWNVKKVASKHEKLLYLYRAAFLDSLFYKYEK